MRRIGSVCLLVVFLLVLVLAQTEQPATLDQLLSGQEVQLDWEDGVVWGDDPLNQPMPQAAELLRDFVVEFVNEERQDFAHKFVLLEILLASSPMLTFSNTEYVSLGLNSTTARWDSATQTLFLQSGRYLPAARPDGTENQPGCGGGFGHLEDSMVYTYFNGCVDFEARKAGYQVMPTRTTYRIDRFTVVYLPPKS